MKFLSHRARWPCSGARKSSIHTNHHINNLSSQSAISTHSRRHFADVEPPVGHGSGAQYRWSRPGGRKLFRKGWKHLTPYPPVTVQERWHRAPPSRLFHPSIIENLSTFSHGELNSLEYRLFFKTNVFSKLLEESRKEYDEDVIEEMSQLSPWHDIPVGFKQSKQLYFNYVNEIPKGQRAKMECATEEEWNPIKQDTKKGELRFFKYGDLPFNYGFIPQTWENPSQKSHVMGEDLGGDNDPIDVVEISGNPIPCGIVLPIKVLGILGLIDEGEIDWKVIGIRKDDPNCEKLNSIEDVKKVFGDSSVIDGVKDWFENYKVPDGKPKNVFSHDGEYQDIDMCVEVIEECHKSWTNLLLGVETDESKKLSLESVAFKDFTAQGLVCSTPRPDFPFVPYPDYKHGAEPGWMYKIPEIREREVDASDITPDEAKL